MYVYIYIILIILYIYIYIYIYMPTKIHVYIYTFKNICVYMCGYIHIHAYIHPYIHIMVYTYIDIYTLQTSSTGASGKCLVLEISFRLIAKVLIIFNFWDIFRKIIKLYLHRVQILCVYVVLPADPYFLVLFCKWLIYF